MNSVLTALWSYEAQVKTKIRKMVTMVMCMFTYLFHYCTGFQQRYRLVSVTPSGRSQMRILHTITYMLFIY